MRKTGCRTSQKSRKRLPGQGCIGGEASGARQQSPWGAELLYWPAASAICQDGLAAKGCGRPAAVLPGKAGKGCLGRDALEEKRVGPVSRALGERSCFTGLRTAQFAKIVWRRRDAKGRLPYFPAAVLPGKAGKGCLGRDALAEKRATPVCRALGERSCFTGLRTAQFAKMVWRRKDAKDRLPYLPEKPEKTCLGKNALVEKKTAPGRRGLGGGTASLALGQHNFPRRAWRRRDAEAMPAYFSAKPEMVSLVACGRKKF